MSRAVTNVTGKSPPEDVYIFNEIESLVERPCKPSCRLSAFQHQNREIVPTMCEIG